MPAPSAGGAHHASSLFQQLLEPTAPALGAATPMGKAISHCHGQGPVPPRRRDGVGLPHHGRGLCHLAPLLPAAIYAYCSRWRHVPRVFDQMSVRNSLTQYPYVPLPRSWKIQGCANAV